MDGAEWLQSFVDLQRPDAVRILDVAEDMADVSTRQVKKLPTLRGTTVVNLFYEDSTRTRISPTSTTSPSPRAVWSNSAPLPAGSR